MSSINNHHINAGIDQRQSALKARVAHGRGGGDPQTPQIIFASGRVQHRVFGVAQG